MKSAQSCFAELKGNEMRNWLMEAEKEIRAKGSDL